MLNYHSSATRRTLIFRTVKTNDFDRNVSWISRTNETRLVVILPCIYSAYDTLNHWCTIRRDDTVKYVAQRTDKITLQWERNTLHATCCMQHTTNLHQGSQTTVQTKFNDFSRQGSHLQFSRTTVATQNCTITTSIPAQVWFKLCTPGNFTKNEPN